MSEIHNEASDSSDRYTINAIARQLHFHLNIKPTEKCSNRHSISNAVDYSIDAHTQRRDQSIAFRRPYDRFSSSQYSTNHFNSLLYESLASG